MLQRPVRSPHCSVHPPNLQVYFVTDGHPINNFEFFRPFIVGLGYPHPTARMPYRCVKQAHQRGRLTFLMVLLPWPLSGHCCSCRVLTYP